MLKHRLRPRLRQMLLGAAVLGIVASLALATVWPPALALAALSLALMAGASVAALTSLRSLCGLWTGPVMAAMHLAWGAGFLFQLLRNGARR